MLSWTHKLINIAIYLNRFLLELSSCWTFHRVTQLRFAFVALLSFPFAAAKRYFSCLPAARHEQVRPTRCQCDGQRGADEGEWGSGWGLECNVDYNSWLWLWTTYLPRHSQRSRRADRLCDRIDCRDRCAPWTQRCWAAERSPPRCRCLYCREVSARCNKI